MNKQPCTICGNTVKTYEGSVCSACGLPLCSGNACHGAHDYYCTGERAAEQLEAEWDRDLDEYDWYTDKAAGMGY